MPSCFISATASPPSLVALGRQHLTRVVERGLDDAEDIQGVRRALLVEQPERRDGER